MGDDMGDDMGAMGGTIIGCNLYAVAWCLQLGASIGSATVTHLDQSKQFECTVTGRDANQ
jgi:hypothetical protein